MKKRFCVLQIAPERPNQKHVEYFENKEQSDFYFVTYLKYNEKALDFCPNTVWSETRNRLCELVPKQYDYYMFMDHDMGIETQKELDAYEQILQDLRLNPAILTFYPGRNIHSPYAIDKKYLKSREYSCIPFTHNGIKIVHRSLIDWFFPMYTRFRVDIDGCHMFNIQEIPFLKHVVCSHNIIHHNNPTTTSDDQAYNKHGAFAKRKMDEMWQWILPSFKKKEFITNSNYNADKDSLSVKNFFVDLFKQRDIRPTKNPLNIDFYDIDKIADFFDLEHEFFLNKKMILDRQNMKLEGSFRKDVESKLLDVISFDGLKKRENPWPHITEKINKELSSKYRNITQNECVETFQNSKSSAFFIHNSKKDKELEEFLEGKSVAFVGPASYLAGQNKGKEIDSCDVVVRIQGEIANKNDYGSRTDIVQSCLNSNYGPPLLRFLEQKRDRGEIIPRFIICNDTVVSRKPDGEWATCDEEYEKKFEERGMRLCHLKNDDDTWDRWSLYWEIYPKSHDELLDDGRIITNSANFNSGYGALNFLLGYPIKKLKVFGIDFYNFANPKNIEEKYNLEYIRVYGKEGTYLGPDKILHDQLSQMKHCRNVLMEDSRFCLDRDVLEVLISESLTRRIERYKLLPKNETHTR